jgi:hypothetical protein
VATSCAIDIKYSGHGGLGNESPEIVKGYSVYQGNVKSPGYGCFFLVMPSHSLDQWARPPRLACMAGRRFKMVYIDGAYDSKAWGAINHFETTQ